MKLDFMAFAAVSYETTPRSTIRSTGIINALISLNFMDIPFLKPAESLNFPRFFIKSSVFLLSVFAFLLFLFFLFFFLPPEVLLSSSDCKSFSANKSCMTSLLSAVISLLLSSVKSSCKISSSILSSGSAD